MNMKKEIILRNPSTWAHACESDDIYNKIINFVAKNLIQFCYPEVAELEKIADFLYRDFEYCLSTGSFKLLSRFNHKLALFRLCIENKQKAISNTLNRLSLYNFIYENKKAGQRVKTALKRAQLFKQISEQNWSLFVNWLNSQYNHASEIKFLLDKEEMKIFGDGKHEGTTTCFSRLFDSPPGLNTHNRDFLSIQKRSYGLTWSGDTYQGRAYVWFMGQGRIQIFNKYDKGRKLPDVVIIEALKLMFNLPKAIYKFGFEVNLPVYLNAGARLFMSAKHANRAYVPKNYAVVCHICGSKSTLEDLHTYEEENLRKIGCCSDCAQHYYCKSCNSLTLHDLNGNCEDCEENIAKCANCGHTILLDNDDYYDDDNGHLYCSDCYSTCPCCDETYAVNSDGCSCAECEECGDLIAYDDQYTSYDNQLLCWGCVGTCEACQKNFNLNDLKTCNSSGALLCSDCYADFETEQLETEQIEGDRNNAN